LGEAYVEALVKAGLVLSAVLSASFPPALTRRLSVFVTIADRDQDAGARLAQRFKEYVQPAMSRNINNIVAALRSSSNAMFVTGMTK
jgi:uncharacterized BrkB/YihY/UPF0761 family membrane protein